MTSLTHDIASVPASRLRSGLTLAVMSAMAFALSGPFAKALIVSGWSAGSAVTARSGSALSSIMTRSRAGRRRLAASPVNGKDTER